MHRRNPDSYLVDSLTRHALIWLLFDTTGLVQALGLIIHAYGAPIPMGGYFPDSLPEQFCSQEQK